MAQNQTPAFFAVALLLIAAATPLALAQLPPLALPVVGSILPTTGSTFDTLTINGSLCCTPTLSCPGGFPLVDAPVWLSYDGFLGDELLGSAITDFNGNFSLTVTNSAKGNFVYGILGGPVQHRLNVGIPPGNLCPLFNSGSTINIGFPNLGGVYLAGDGIHGVATVMDSQAGAPV